MAGLKNLAQFDFLNDFSAIEAAALMYGQHPVYLGQHDDPYTDDPICKRITEDYVKATIFGDKYPYCLVSISLEALLVDSDRDAAIVRAKTWANGPRGQIELQRFERTEIVRWLTQNNLPSIYVFDRGGEAPALPAQRWPWGDYQTEALKHLEAAAIRFWVNYDPTDATTAPTNVKVSEWLQTDRNVSKTMADSIASMLRPDGLPTGPRK